MVSKNFLMARTRQSVATRLEIRYNRRMANFSFTPPGASGKTDAPPTRESTQRKARATQRKARKAAAPKGPDWTARYRNGELKTATDIVPAELRRAPSDPRSVLAWTEANLDRADPPAPYTRRVVQDRPLGHGSARDVLAFIDAHMDAPPAGGGMESAVSVDSPLDERSDDELFDELRRQYVTANAAIRRHPQDRDGRARGAASRVRMIGTILMARGYTDRRIRERANIV